MSHSITFDRRSVLVDQPMSGLDGRGNMTPILPPHTRSASLIAALFFASATCSNASNAGAAVSSSASYREQRRLDVPRSGGLELPRSVQARSVCSRNGNRSSRTVPAFGSAAAAGRWNARLKRHRDGTSATRAGATSIVSPRIPLGHDREC